MQLTPGAESSSNSDPGPLSGASTAGLSSPGAGTDSRARIMEALWRKPGRSRIELAEVLGMDKSTMSRGVARLLDSGLIEESETKDSGPQGGRRAVGLVPRGDWGLWLGLELQPDECRGVLVDLAGEPRGEFLFDADIHAGSLRDMLTRSQEEAALRSSGLGISLIGAALAIPGPVRPGTGIVERSRPLGIDRPMDLAALGFEVLGMPVVIGNDVDCGCRGEMHFTQGEQSDNFLYLLAEARRSGLSLGMGTVLGGALHRGDHGAAGEFFSVFQKSGQTQLALDRDTVIRAASDREALLMVAEELAPQTAMIANVLDIDRIIVGGLFRTHFNRIEPVFTEALGARRTYPDLASPELLSASRGDESVAYGAAVHFTENPANQEYWRNI